MSLSIVISNSLINLSATGVDGWIGDGTARTLGKARERVIRETGETGVPDTGAASDSGTRIDNTAFQMRSSRGGRHHGGVKENGHRKDVQVDFTWADDG